MVIVWKKTASKIIAFVGIVIALFTLVFGDNLYGQLTGRSIFDQLQVSAKPTSEIIIATPPLLVTTSFPTTIATEILFVPITVEPTLTIEQPRPVDTPSMISTSVSTLTAESAVPADSIEATIEALEASGTPVLYIWVTSEFVEGISAVGGLFEEEYGVEVIIEELTLSNINSQILDSSVDVRVPEIFVSTQGQLDQLVRERLILPLDFGRRSVDFSVESLEAFLTEGELYALPYEECEPVNDSRGFFIPHSSRDPLLAQIFLTDFVATRKAMDSFANNDLNSNNCVLAFLP